MCCLYDYFLQLRFVHSDQQIQQILHKDLQIQQNIVGRHENGMMPAAVY